MVNRIQRAQEVQKKIVEEREKAKKNQKAAEKLKNIAMTALSILEKPPTFNLMFDNFGKPNDIPSMGKYPTRDVNIADVVDLGERIC